MLTCGEADVAVFVEELVPNHREDLEEKETGVHSGVTSGWEIQEKATDVRPEKDADIGWKCQKT